MYLSALGVLACPHCRAPFILSCTALQRDEFTDLHKRAKVSAILTRTCWKRILNSCIAGKIAVPEKYALHDSDVVDPEALTDEEVDQFYELLFLQAVVEGELICSGCNKAYEIRNRIPRLTLLS